MTNLFKNLIAKMTVSFSLLFSAKVVKQLVKNFSEINGALFVGIREYEAKTSGEVANHVVNANFNYGNAIIKDMKKLQNATNKDIMDISVDFNIETELIQKAIDKLLTSFINNQNKETQSNQSKAQENAYIHVTNSIKMNKETKNFHIYALSINKSILVKGEHKKVNSRPLTIAQNAVKKYFNFTTSKYRNFIIKPDMLTAVAIKGKTIDLI
jgi:hypothetical protein